LPLSPISHFFISGFSTLLAILPLIFRFAAFSARQSAAAARAQRMRAERRFVRQ